MPAFEVTTGRIRIIRLGATSVVRVALAVRLIPTNPRFHIVHNRGTLVHEYDGKTSILGVDFDGRRKCAGGARK